MRKLCIAFSLISTTAFADEAPKPSVEPSKPSVEEVTINANRLLAAVSGQRDACMNREARVAAEMDRLNQELSALKAKKAEPKSEKEK
jgi:hypothetical protein